MNQTVHEEHIKAPVPVHQKIHDLSKEVSKQVMEKLGTPPEFHRCTARKVSDASYRVNVWISAALMSTGEVSDSFFVKLEEGVIVSSDPEIKKKYHNEPRSDL